MLQALAGLLPMIAEWAAGAGATAAAGEAAAAGTGAAGASAATGGGFMASLARMLGGAGPAAFGSEAELGAGMRQASQIADLIGVAQAAHGSSQQRSAADAAKYREDEAKYLYGDPGTDARLAEEARKRAAYEAEIVNHRRQQAELNDRINATLHPDEGGFDMAGMAGGLAGSFVGFGGLAALFGGGGQAAQPGLAAELIKARDDAAFAGPAGWLARKLPGVQQTSNAQQAMLQPLTDLGVGQTEGRVIGQAAGFGSRVAQTAMNPMALMRGELATEVSRLPGLLRDWGNELVESRRHLADYNGTLAIAFADAQRRDILRQMESGSRTAGATAGLSDALQDLADLLQPIKDTVTIVLSSGMELGVRALGVIISQLNTLLFFAKLTTPLLNAADKIVEQLGKRGDGAVALPIMDFIRETKDRPIPRGVPRR